MLLSKKPLVVVANPFAAPLDHEGRPCGGVQYDPSRAEGFVRYIGAEKEENLGERRQAGSARGSRFRVLWAYNVAPVEIEDTIYHRERVRSGELFAADERTHKLSASGGFKKPEDRLREAFISAINNWAADYDGETPADAMSWFRGEHPIIQNWPAVSGSTLAKERDARAQGAKTNASKAVESREKNVDAAKAQPGRSLLEKAEGTFDTVKDGSVGGMLPAVSPSAYPPGAWALEPLSLEPETAENPAVLEPADGTFRKGATS